MNECLNPETIRDFLEDVLDEDARAKAVAHIENCEVCQRSIEQLLDEQTVFSFASDQTSIGGMSLQETRFSKLGSSIHESGVSAANRAQSLPKGELPDIDGYTIVAEVGRGASGVVYEAMQEDLDRRVAIKLISGQLFSQSDLKLRFLREAKSVAALNHPNIAQLYQIAESPQFGPYLVFEFVDALPLNELIRNGGAIQPERAVRIGRDVAAAARHAHDQNLVHRDLKPSNILIERETDLAKVVDFGLAVDPEQQSRITLDSFIAGTPAYMSPEQVQSPRDVDHRSDIYSAGVILYEMLTGDVPFRGLSKKTLGRVVNEEPRKLTVINPDVPRDLETICLKALSKLPQHRYANMEELDDELRRWQEGRPILAKPVSRLSRTWRWSKRNPLSASLGAIAMMLLLMITVGSIVGVMMLANANRKAVAASTRSAKAATEARLQRDQLLQTLDSLVYDLNDDVDTRYVDQDQLQVQMLQLARKGLSETSQANNPGVTRRMADIDLRLASVHIRNHEFDQAKNYLDQALSITGDLDKTDPHQAQRIRSFANWQIVNMLALQDNVVEASAAVTDAQLADQKLDMERFSELDRFDYLMHMGYARLNLGLTYLEEQWDPGKAIDQLQIAFDAARNELPDDLDQSSNMLTADSFDNKLYQILGLVQFAADGLAESYFSEGDMERSAQMDSRSRRLQDQLAIYEDGSQNSHVMPVSNDDNDAIPVAELAPLARSEQFYKFLLDGSGKSEDPATLLIDAGHHFRLGNVYLETAEFEQAIKSFNICKDIASKIQPNEEVGMPEIQAILADAQLRLIEISNRISKNSSALVSELKDIISELDKSKPISDMQHRTRNRIRYDASKFGLD